MIYWLIILLIIFNAPIFAFMAYVGLIKKHREKVFLDDIRMPIDIYPTTKNRDWVIIRDFEAFKKYINSNPIPFYISFDNDLGEFEDKTPKPEGVDVVKWIVFEKELDISNTDFKVHSANTARRDYIEGTMNNWKDELIKRYEENKNGN